MSAIVVSAYPKPDWSAWGLGTAAHLWEAVALSLSIDPHQLNVESKNPASSFGDFTKPDDPEFRKRLFAAERNVLTELKDAVITWPDGGLALSDDAKFLTYGAWMQLELAKLLVRLPLFAAWAISVGWGNLSVEFKNLASGRQVGKWPWGRYSTTLLEHLAAAVETHWLSYDPKNPGSAPKSADVQHWLEQAPRSVPSTTAKAITRIIRANKLRPGPRGASNDDKRD
jgi:hypothetical protein